MATHPRCLPRVCRTASASVSGWADSSPASPARSSARSSRHWCATSLGEHRTAIGLVMAIDNVLLLLLVPWAGAASDRASAAGRGRLPIVIGGLVLPRSGWRCSPGRRAFGIAGMIAAIVLLYTGINVQRSPFQALLADAVPSRFRSLATGSVTFQMCVGAIVFLMLGRMLGMRRVPHRGRHRARHRRRTSRRPRRAAAARAPRGRGDRSALCSTRCVDALRGVVPGMRAIFVAALLLQLDLPDLHDVVRAARHRALRRPARGRDDRLHRVGGRRRDRCAARRIRRRAVRPAQRDAARVRLMAACLVALDRVTSVSQATPLLALASAAWTFPTVNAYPMFVEPIPRERRGVLSALFLLCMALGGGIGDPMNGVLFDLFGSYRPLFLMMAVYTALAFVAVLTIPRGAGEAGVGPVGA